jgi:hypothetical protein
MRAATPAYTPAADSIRRRIGQLRIGPRQHYRRLTVFPLLAPAAGEAPLALGAAVQAGQAAVREQPQPAIDSLLVINRGARPLVVLDGELLAGGWQDRLVAAAGLIGPWQQATLPVGCVEHGRWREDRPAFTAVGVAHVALRRLIAAGLAASRAATGERAADQTAIWEEVGQKRRAAAAAAPTEALRDVFAGRAAELDRYDRALPPVNGSCCGLAVAIAGRVVALDLFAQPALLAAYWRALVRSAALDALDARGPDQPAPLPPVAAVLHQAAHAAVTTYAGLGRGLEARLQADSLHGAAVLDDDCLVHLALYPASAGRSRRASGRMRSGAEPWPHGRTDAVRSWGGR